MNLALSAILIICLANFFGPHFAIGYDAYVALSGICFIAILFGVIFRTIRPAALHLGLFVWILIHSPPEDQIQSKLLDAPRHGSVIYSSGCRLLNDALLVVVDDRISFARGAAIAGDMVILSTKRVFNLQRTIATVETPVDDVSLYCDFSRGLRDFFYQRVETSEHSNWLRAFILGDSSSLDRVTTESMRRLGLLHIMVLSGGHLYIVLNFALFLVRFLPIFAYVAGWTSMKVWPKVWILSHVFGVTCVVLFAVAVGFSQSIQRALICLLLLTMTPRRVSRKVRLSRNGWAVIIQAALFPCDLLSLSNLLTWAGTLLLQTMSTAVALKSKTQIFLQLLGVQIVFFMTSLLAFGSVTLPQIIINIIFVPFFNVFLSGNLLALTPLIDSEALRWFMTLQMQFLELLRNISAWIGLHPWLHLQLNQWSPVYGKIALGVLIIGMLCLGKQKQRHSMPVMRSTH
jgi:hypothetical protein